MKHSPACKHPHSNPPLWSTWCVPATESFLRVRDTLQNCKSD